MKKRFLPCIAPHAIILSIAIAAWAFGSPKDPAETLRRQFSEIQAAQSLDEVRHLVPAQHREMLSQMSPEQKAAALISWKERVSSLEVVRQRVDGRRAAVLVWDRNDNQSLTVRKMQLESGEWQEESDVVLWDVSPGAEGSFRTSGPEEEVLHEGVIGQSWINGAPILSISDPLDFSERELRLQLPIPDCPEEPGSIELKPVPAGNGLINGGLEGTNRHGAEMRFYADFAGALEITESSGDRFSANFSFSVAAEEGREPVQIQGAFHNAFLPCRRN